MDFLLLRCDDLLCCSLQQSMQLILILGFFQGVPYRRSVTLGTTGQRIRNDLAHPVSYCLQLVQFSLHDFYIGTQRFNFVFELCLLRPQRFTVNGI